MMDIKDLRIVYMGTPDMSARLLEHLVQMGLNIVGVVAQTDQKIGRKQQIQEVPTKIVAKKFNIPVYQPVKIKHDYSFMSQLNPDLILCFAYGQIIPEEVLKMPRYGALNYHGSLLPKYRGAAPIQYALMNNDTESGVCLMEMVKKMDAGRVYAVERFSISEHDNYETTAAKLVETCMKISNLYLDDYVNGLLKGQEQEEKDVTFAPSIKSEQEKIDLHESVKNVFGLIRALSPHIGAYVIYKNQPLKIFEAEIVSFVENSPIGTIVKADKMGLHIQVRGGVLALKTVQKAGKKQITYKDFINGEKDLMGLKVF